MGAAIKRKLDEECRKMCTAGRNTHRGGLIPVPARSNFFYVSRLDGMSLPGLL